MLAVASVLLLAGCTQLSAPEYVATEWQVTGVYTDAQAPTTVPEESAGVARLVFGQNALTLDTGCRQFGASVDYHQIAPLGEVTTATIGELNEVFDREDCSPLQQLLDEQLVEVIGGEVTLRQAAEYLLTLTTDGVGRVELAVAQPNEEESA